MGKFQIVRGTIRRPDANLITGRSNIGKTWFLSTIPNIFLICTEDGLKGASPDHIDQVQHFGRQPKSFRELLEMIDEVAAMAREMGLRGLGLDSLSGCESLINMDVCNRESVAHMDAKAFKELWTAAQPLHKALRDRLDKARDVGGLHLWIAAHSSEVTETTPDGDQFTKMDLAFEGSGSKLIQIRESWRRWADNVLFIDWDAGIKKGSIGKKQVGTYKSRIFRTRESPSHYAKNRRNLPEKLPATWSDLAKALGAGQTAPDDKLRAQIAAVMGDLSPADKKAIDTDLRNAKTNSALAAVLSRAKGMVSAAQVDEDEPQPQAARTEDDGTVPPEDEPPTDEASPVEEEFPAPEAPAPKEPPTPMFVKLGAAIEQANDKGTVDTAWKEANAAFGAKLISREEMKALADIARGRVESFAKTGVAA